MIHKYLIVKFLEKAYWECYLSKTIYEQTLQKKAACQNWGEKRENTCDFCTYKGVLQEKKYGKTEEGLQTLYICCISLVYMSLDL